MPVIPLHREIERQSSAWHVFPLDEFRCHYIDLFPGGVFVFIPKQPEDGNHLRGDVIPSQRAPFEISVGPSPCNLTHLGFLLSLQAPQDWSLDDSPEDYSELMFQKFQDFEVLCLYLGKQEVSRVLRDISFFGNAWCSIKYPMESIHTVWVALYLCKSQMRMNSESTLPACWFCGFVKWKHSMSW